MTHLLGRCISPSAMLCVALIYTSIGLAQLSPPNPDRPRIHVSYVTVKPDMLQEWRDIQQNEVVPALKKAGLRRTVWRNAPFNGNQYEFVVISPIENYGQYDQENPVIKAVGQEAATRVISKLRKCIVSQTNFVSTGRRDLANPPAADQVPRIAVFTTFRVQPGKAPDYENYLKTEIQPIYKKNNVLYGISQRGFGAPSGEWVTTIYANKYADLEGGTTLVKILGQEGAAKVIAKAAGIRTAVRTVVRIRVPELSVQ